MESWSHDEVVCTPTKARHVLRLTTPPKPDEPVCFPEGLGGHDDHAHRKLCRAKRCSRCKWLKHQAEWSAKFLWLQCRLDLAHKSFGIGCTLCEAGSSSGEFQKLGLLTHSHRAAFYNFTVQATASTDLREQRMSHHADTPAHKMAETLVTTGEVSTDGAAPTAAAWEKVVFKISTAPPIAMRRQILLVLIVPMQTRFPFLAPKVIQNPQITFKYIKISRALV